MSFDDVLDLLLGKLNVWLEALVTNLPNIAVALGIAAAFGLLSRPASRLAGRFVRRLQASPAIVTLTSSLARIVVVALGAGVALGVLGLDKTILSMLAGAGVVGIALGFAFQDLAANLIAGVAMGVRKPFRVGDLVETNGHFGTVLKLNLRNTLVRTFEGETVIVPNKEVFERPLVNHSMSGKRRVDVEVGVAYDSDLDQVVEVAAEAVEGLDFLRDGEPVEVLAKGFGASSIDFSVRYWIDADGDVGLPQARHAGVTAIKRAFDEHGIEIPFPIRTLDLGPARPVLLEAARRTRSNGGARAGEPDREPERERQPVASQAGRARRR